MKTRLILLNVMAVLVVSGLGLGADSMKPSLIETSHERVVKMLGGDSSKLPAGRWQLLGGSGLDKNVVVRQLTSTGKVCFYVVNPLPWRVKVGLHLRPADTVVTDLLSGKAVPLHEPKPPAADKSEAPSPSSREAELTFDLEPHKVKAFAAAGSPVIARADVVVDAAAKAWVEARLRDIEAILPQLPTHRPNLVVNGDFEEVGANDMPVNWKMFNWHLAGADYGADEVNHYEGKRSLCLDNSAHGKTIGAYSGKISVLPGRKYTLIARMGTDVRPGKGRLCLIGDGHLVLRCNLDRAWREFKLLLSAEKDKGIARNFYVRVAVHNDSKGKLWVDQVRLLDTTHCSLTYAKLTDEAVAALREALNAADYVQCCKTLAAPEVTAVLKLAAGRRTGNEWRVIGPFQCSSDAAFSEALPVETDALKGGGFLAKCYPSSTGKDVSWFADWTVSYGEKNHPGFINLGASIGPFNKSVAYAYTRVHSSANQRVNLLIGSDDGVAVWLNGKLVHRLVRDRAAQPADDVVPAQLKVGWNAVLVKVLNHTKEWGFFFTVAGEDKKPIAVKYSPG